MQCGLRPDVGNTVTQTYDVLKTWASYLFLAAMWKSYGVSLSKTRYLDLIKDITHYDYIYSHDNGGDDNANNNNKTITIIIM